MSQFFRHYVWEPVFVMPLKRLYFHGPSNIILGLGFWGGVSNERICATVKNTSEDVWSLAPKQCNQITEDLFESFLITVESILYFYLLMQIILMLPTLFFSLTCKLFKFCSSSSSRTCQPAFENKVVKSKIDF